MFVSCQMELISLCETSNKSAKLRFGQIKVCATETGYPSRTAKAFSFSKIHSFSKNGIPTGSFSPPYCRKSVSSLSPLEQLHLSHKACRFSYTVLPPLERGRIWSM